ncbi:MAG: group I intron-associated PD-(D/E)XK endonuclease [Proteobacteria bacterium]|nr:group I intron-associated PD-(D/E)XK endonuclease [Pseudomonadota bacterium]
MEIGKAGEYLALADLLLNGWVAYPTSQGVPYDVAVDIGERVIRVQVKSTLLPKSGSSMNRGTPLYIFSVRRAGKSGKRRYGSDDFDPIFLSSPS